ncbi:NACHT domain-containing protein [Undibacterium sp.]|uniref:NACHT domain-containing protein n=1 Tax=Undibacterium sp. TaxID=1914977 RepID=UPI0037526A9E
MDKVKPSAIPYSGYVYQTLQGMSWLVEWLASPTRYQKMRFECNDKSLAPQGIDDIVAWRSDGKVDYAQVKFTPNPDVYKLTWKWLLELPSSQKPRSLMMKWSDAVQLASIDSLGLVTLITNREPDEEFRRCLDGNKICFNRLSIELQKTLIEQLGGETEVRQILDILKIKHSDCQYLMLQSVILGELLKLGYDEGSYQRLHSESTKWAIFDNLPAPDGYITIDAVRAVLSTRRPEPISQEFEIPNGYITPNLDFHRALLKKISKADDKNNVHILYGPPGRGKSTYLSYLTNALDSLNIPVIRHHYFLSTTDSTTDRMRIHAVANSLLAQIANLRVSGVASNSHEAIRKEITECAENFKARGVPLVIIIDGLDHVWRRERETRPLNELFQQLLPVPSNTHLIIGTQPVGDDQLPDRLVAELPRDRWDEVPTMSPQSVLAYVVSLMRSRRWIRRKHHKLKHEILSSSRALYERTGGHPLHLIFSVEELLKKCNPPTEHLIHALPQCPDNDIRKYYQELWLKLTYAQQDSLHLICELPYYWPEHAFEDISSTNKKVSVDGITHLLFESTVGFRPFHESLSVFVTSNPSHLARIAKLLPHVEKWLENSAPAVVRNSWLYSLRAKQGDHIQLAQTLTREWVVDRLVEGYPTSTIERLLQEAEHYMFDDGDFPEAYRLRALKHRVNQGPQFQINDMQALRAMCWSVSLDDSLLNETVANAASFSPMWQGSLSSALAYKKDLRSGRLARRAINRFQAEYRFKNDQHDSQIDREFRYLLERLAASNSVKIEYLKAPGVMDGEPEGNIISLLRGLVQCADIQNMFVLHAATTNQSTAALIEIAILKVAITKKIDLLAWDESKTFWASDIAVLHLALKSQHSDGTFNREAFPKVPIVWEKKGESGIDSGAHLIFHFFNSLALHLLPVKSVCVLPLKANRKPELQQFWESMERAAETAAQMLKTRQPLEYALVFDSLRHIPLTQGNNFKSMEEYQGIKRALHKIATNLHLLSMAYGIATPISLKVFESAKSSVYFGAGQFMADIADMHIPILDPDLLTQLVIREVSRIAIPKEEIGTTIETLMEVAQLCATQRRDDDVRKLCQKIWTLVLSYGKHKDTSVLELLEAIENFASVDTKSATDMLVSISGVIENVTKFTDGDETHNVHKWAADALRVANPTLLVKKYRYHLDRGEWSSAEETLQGGLKNIDQSSRFSQALARTGLRDSEIPHSWITDSNNGTPQSMHLTSQKFLGIELTSKKRAESTSYKNNNFAKDFSLYNPSQFAELLMDMRDTGHFYEREYLVNWYNYWKMIKHSTLVLELHKYLFDGAEYDDDVRFLLDQLFESTQSLFGKDKAFEIAVLAHVKHSAWSNWPLYESSEASMERLQKIASLYPEKAIEFIVRTCTTLESIFGISKGKTYTIPGGRLVFFLVQTGNHEQAREYLAKMVSVLLEETACFTLSQPLWATADSEISVEEYPLQLLVARLKSGVATTRLWAIQEISELLIGKDTKDIVESTLRGHIQDIRLCTDLIEALSIFFISYNEGFEFSSQLRVMDIASAFSEELCDRLHIEKTKLPVLVSPNGFSAARDFFDVDGLPKIISANLKELQAKTAFPFVAQANFEATRLLNLVNYSDNSQYFFGGIRGPMNGALTSNATQIARSSYMRAIEVAFKVGAINWQQNIEWSSAATPILPLLAKLRPTEPTNWKWFCETLRSNPTNLIEVVSNFLKQLNKETLAIGAFNGPVYISENEFLVLDLVLCSYPSQMSIAEGLETLPTDERYRDLFILDPFIDDSVYKCTVSNKNIGEAIAHKLALPFLVIPYAYLHSEIFQRGIYLPVSTNAEKEFYVIPNGSLISIYSDQDTIGHFSYWNTEWSPTYFLGKGPGCATLLKLEKDTLSSLQDENEKLAYRCAITRYSRSQSYDNFEATPVEILHLELN